MYKEFWKFLNRAKKKPAKAAGKEASTPQSRTDDEFKELLGEWVYENLTGVAIVITDRKGIIKRLNAEAQALTSIPGNTANGKHLGSIFPALSYDFQSQLDETKSVVMELSFTDYKGKQKYFKSTLGPLNHALKKFIGFALIFQDITEQKELKEKLRLAEELRVDAGSGCGVRSWTLNFIYHFRLLRFRNSETLVGELVLFAQLRNSANTKMSGGGRDLGSGVV